MYGEVLQHGSDQRDRLRVTHISKLLRRYTGLWFVQLIGLHESVIGVYLYVAFTCRFFGKYERIFVFFIPSNLSLLTVVVEVILCR